jgi:hypothetical protein
MSNSEKLVPPLALRVIFVCVFAIIGAARALAGLRPEKSAWRILMLGKCANPVCLASFRKLGSGKLFAFELVMNARYDNVPSGASLAKTARGPVFFWLCETCSLSFTLGLDAAGQLTLQRIPEGVRVTIFDRRPLDQTE